MKFKFEQRIKVRCPHCQFSNEIGADTDEISLPFSTGTVCGDYLCHKPFLFSIKEPRLEMVTDTGII